MLRALFAVIVCIIAVIAPPQAAHGQDTLHLEAPKELSAPSLFEGIQLSAAQQDSIEAIKQRYRPLLKQVNRDYTTAASRLSHYIALRVKQRAEMRTVLTAEQQPIFDKNAAEIKKVDEKILKAQLKRAQDG